MRKSDAFLVYAFAGVDSNPMSPIPEPCADRMVRAGLALLVPVVRRRRRLAASMRAR
jgi:hypothetical protein